MHTSLSDAIDDFIRFRRSQDIAKNTIKQDESSLRRFLLVTGNVWVHTLSERHVTRFFEELAKTKQPQSMRNDYGTLSVFFDWARQTKRMAMDSNPLYGRRPPRRLQKEKNRIHFTKFPQLLDAAGRRSPRDRVAVALLLYTLGRDQEIADLRVRDVDLEGGYLYLRVHKGKTEDRMPICSELDTELRQWLSIYTTEVGFLEPHYYLVPSRVTMPLREGRRIVANQHLRYTPEQPVSWLGQIVKPALVDIGYPITDRDGKKCGEGSHTVRRSGARALFDSLVERSYDGALRVVQSMLHHKSVTVTEIYLGLSADRFTRDELIRGKTMYQLTASNVTQLHKAHEA